jgi:FkbM family methyltransferase
MDAELKVHVLGDFVMQVHTSEPMGRALAASGLWEPHVTAAFQAVLSPGDLCVDVGANIGYNSLLAARLVGPAGHVYALEPSPGTYEALVRNIELNIASNVTALRVAAGATNGEVLLDDRPDGQSVRSSVSAEGERTPGGSVTTKMSVPVQTVASLIRTSDLPKLRLIKIDVEGFELEVLRGIDPIFRLGGRPAIITELHRGHVEETVTFLLELGDRYGLTAYKLLDDDVIPRRGAQRVGLPRWIDFPIVATEERLPNGSHVILISQSPFGRVA